MAAYIFLGPETGKKNDAIDEIRKKISKNGQLEETVFYAGETEAGVIANVIQNHSLFAQTRLIIIKNAEQLKKKDELALIGSCMTELDADAALILISDDYKLAAALEGCCSKDNRRIFYELFENQKSEWVKCFFQRQGFSIESGGIDAILDMVENNTEALRRECSLLMLFLPKDRPVSAEDAEQWLSRSREESPFTLFSRIAAGDSAKAVESLHTLLGAKSRPAEILAGLAWCWRKFCEYLALFGSCANPDNFELKKIGLSASKAKDYAKAALRYNAASAETCLALTAEYDILTRSSGAVWEEMLMDMYILKVMNV